MLVGAKGDAENPRRVARERRYEVGVKTKERYNSCRESSPIRSDAQRHKTAVQNDIQNGRTNIQTGRTDIQNGRTDIQTGRIDIQNGRTTIQSGHAHIYIYM